KDNLMLWEVAGFIDEIEILWLKELEVICYELGYLTSNSQCFLLSGATYLNIESNEHYYFKTFGDYHIISDPLLKLEGFFRTNENNVDEKTTINHFRNAYNDTLLLLEKYKDCFFVLPIRELFWKDNRENNLDVLNTYFWKFISEIFNETFDKNKDFCNVNKSFDEIEKNLDKFVLHQLINIDSYDSQLKLKERAKRYQESETNFFALTKNMSEPEIFLLMTRNHIWQVIDILLTCTSIGLIPYIRYEVTFRYMSLIMYSFLKDEVLKDILKNIVIFYVFYKSTDANVFEDIDFDTYCFKLKEVDLLKIIIKKIDNSEIDVFDCKLDDIVTIIQSEYNNFLCLFE
ncbi:MAG: hypothetical protein ACOCRK_09910, partial [bacterium]